TFILPTAQPIVTQSPSRELRERVHRASVARGSGVDPASDTRELVLRLARLRAERAVMLGHPHHAAYVAAGGTARSTDAVAGMLAQLAGPAGRNAHPEAEDRKSTRLNSSHVKISYAVFCLQKKNCHRLIRLS